MSARHVRRRSPKFSTGTVETKLEVVVLPVSDVERAKRFDESLGWRARDHV